MVEPALSSLGRAPAGRHSSHASSHGRFASPLTAQAGAKHLGERAFPWDVRSVLQLASAARATTRLQVAAVVGSHPLDPDVRFQVRPTPAVSSV